MVGPLLFILMPPQNLKVILIIKSKIVKSLVIFKNYLLLFYKNNFWVELLRL